MPRVRTQGRPRKRRKTTSSCVDPRYLITLNNPVENVESFDDASENCVVTVEVRLGRMRDEILTPARIRTGESHPDCSSLVTATIHLVAYRIPRTAIAIITRIAILCDEIRDHPMKASVAIVAGA